MDLKIKDVADLLSVSETTIRRWLSEGKIPSYKIGGQYRFSRGEIQNWVVSRKPQQNEKADEEAASAKGGSKQFSLYRSIHKGGILHGVPGETKEQVIRNSMGQIAQSLNLDGEVLSDLLMDRENLQPTALNNGIGVPHTRDFLLSAHQDVVTVVFPEHPIAYGALDGKPVHTLFFLFACEDKRHLHLLAKIAHLCNQPAAIELLQSKPSKDHLLAYIKEWETTTF